MRSKISLRLSIFWMPYDLVSLSIWNSLSSLCTHEQIKTHRHKKPSQIACFSKAQTHVQTHRHTHTHRHAHVAHVMGFANFSASLATLPYLSAMQRSRTRSVLEKLEVHARAGLVCNKSQKPLINKESGSLILKRQHFTPLLTPIDWYNIDCVYLCQLETTFGKPMPLTPLALLAI